MSKETSQTQRVVLLAGYTDIGGIVEIVNSVLTSTARNDITVFTASTRKTQTSSAQLG